MDAIFHRVAVMKNVQKEHVQNQWKGMLQRLFYTLGCGNFVFIPGFGLFFEQNGYIFFTRIVYHDRKIKKTCIDKHKLFQIKNVKYEELNQIVYNPFMLPDLSKFPQLINTIRIKHIDTDPIDLAVFIEINREIIVKHRDLYIEELGWFYNIEHSLSNWYQHMQHLDLNALKKMAENNQTKINSWVPNLITLLKEKEQILEQQS
jgi:hypothetical protein